MIANYEATLKYMSALNIEEGLYHWQQELITGGSDEVTFIGHFGKALSPIQLNGFPMMLDLPQSERLFSHWFYFGRAVSFRPFAHMRSRNRIDVRTAPCMSECSWRGRPMIPISVLLEFARSLGDWVVPEGYPDLQLEEIRDVHIALPPLTITGSAYEFEKEASGQWQGPKWLVTVSMTSGPGSLHAPIAGLTLVYGDGFWPLAWTCQKPPSAMRPPTPAPRPVCAGRARCSDSRDGSRRTTRRLSACYAQAPRRTCGRCRFRRSRRCRRLIWRMSSGLALQASGQPELKSRLVAISRIACFSGAGPCHSIRRSQDAAWLLLDEAARVVLRVEGISGRSDVIHSIEEKGKSFHAA